jgi:site-specific DNA recombinase
MRVVIYTRVSSGEQAQDGVSLENQLMKCRIYCQYKDMEIIEEITDEGVSGKKTDKRPGFVRIMDLVKNRECDAVVVYSLSRFCRNTAGTITAIEQMNKKDVAFHSLTENIDTTTAVGKLFLSMIAAFSEFECNITGERTKSALDYKKSKGEALGSVPYGFKRSGKMLVRDEAEQEIITLIMGLHFNDYSYGEICTELQSRGLTPRGQAWHRQSISNIIKNNLQCEKTN